MSGAPRFFSPIPLAKLVLGPGTPGQEGLAADPGAAARVLFSDSLYGCGGRSSGQWHGFHQCRRRISRAFPPALSPECGGRRSMPSIADSPHILAPDAVARPDAQDLAAAVSQHGVGTLVYGADEKPVYLAFGYLISLQPTAQRLRGPRASRPRYAIFSGMTPGWKRSAATLPTRHRVLPVPGPPMTRANSPPNATSNCCSYCEGIPLSARPMMSSQFVDANVPLRAQGGLCSPPTVTSR